MRKKILLLILTITFLISMSSTSSAKTIDSKKVLIIGWDGADWDIIDPLLKQGKLPNLEKLIKRGDRSNLESTKPSMSPVAWTTFSTGKNPGKHGIFSFLTKKDDKFIPLTGKNVQGERFWDTTSNNNLLNLIINVPMTYPPEKLKGKLISGYLSIENTTYTYPKSLQEELEAKGYKIEALAGGFEEGKEKEFLQDLNYTVEKRTEVALDLLKREDWNLSVVVYTGLDRLQHYFWKYQDKEGSSYKSAIRDHYQKLDEQVGELINKTENDKEVIVLSDHGFGPLKGEVYINHWLKEEGYLELDQNKSLLEKIGLTQQGIISFLRKIKLFKPVKFVLKKIGIYKTGESLPRPTLDDLDLEKTKAFANNFGGGVYITAENYEEVRSEIKRKLESLENPETGEKFFSEVVKKEKIYSGKKLEEAPDLIIDSPNWDPVGYLGYGKLYSKEIKKSGKHRNTGILVTSFPIKKENNSLQDIAPTVLDLFNIKPDESIDGESLLVSELETREE